MLFPLWIVKQKSCKIETEASLLQSGGPLIKEQR